MGTLGQDGQQIAGGLVVGARLDLGEDEDVRVDREHSASAALHHIEEGSAIENIHAGL